MHGWRWGLGAVLSVVLAVGCGDDAPTPNGDAGDAGSDGGGAGSGGRGSSMKDAGARDGGQRDADTGDAGEDAARPEPDGSMRDAQPDDGAVPEDASPDADASPQPDLPGLGEPCEEDTDACEDGLECGSNGRCCTDGEDCCEVAADCPASYADDHRCFEADTCWGSVETATCDDNVCGSMFVASSTDATGCEGETCEEASCDDAVATTAGLCDADGECGTTTATCPNHFGCDGDHCATSCEQGTTNRCADEYTCASGGAGCVPLANPGTDCSAAAGGASVCAGGTQCSAVNERCCAPGSVCCEEANDCPDEAGGTTYDGVLCAEVATCTGEARTKSCEDNVCGFDAVPSAEACEGRSCNAGVCHEGSCEALLGGEVCRSNTECLSRDCRKLVGVATGICGSAPGELCLPGEDECSGGPCWYGDAAGKTFRCYSAACAGKNCTFWNGDERQGTCDGVVQPFTPAFLGSPVSACYDSGQGGLMMHEAACANGFDDDFDGQADVNDPDCKPGSGDFWRTATDRGVRALCELGLCGDNASNVVQCDSGVGGCFDAACHSAICWPDAGACTAITTPEAKCKWWNSATDLDDDCDAAELIDRPNGSTCGAGCVCDGGTAEEFLCGDTLDNDGDGLTDANDPDCNRQHGAPCTVGRWEGAPVGDFLMSGFDGARDQCAGDDVCWCADAACSAGVCLGAQASCILSNSFYCHYYAAPTTNDCGAAGNRTDGAPALPSAAWLGSCTGGAFVPPGAGQPGDSCDAWTDCASALCLCANADCSARACWAVADCGLNLCSYRESATACHPLDTSASTLPCAGSSDYAGVDLGEGCICSGGAMLERSCDDGITNDWPQPLIGGIVDTSADWYDVDCYGKFGSESDIPWVASLRARYQ